MKYLKIQMHRLPQLSLFLTLSQYNYTQNNSSPLRIYTRLSKHTSKNKVTHQVTNVATRVIWDYQLLRDQSDRCCHRGHLPGHRPRSAPLGGCSWWTLSWTFCFSLQGCWGLQTAWSGRSIKQTLCLKKA